MQTLKKIIAEAEVKKIAIGHFNVSDIAALKGIVRAAEELKVPVIIGLSEGERNFFGIEEAALIVRNLREKHGLPVYLNADHTYSIENVKKAVEAGCDAVIFDGAKLPLEENIAKTKEVVQYVKSVSANRRTGILVEGELGYIGTSSELFTEIPTGAAIKEEDLTTVEDAVRFVKETGVDMFAPAVGNIHGMSISTPNPNLNITRIKAIKDAVGIPIVLHGGSGIKDVDFVSAAGAGISLIHINTEIRLAWKEALQKSLAGNSNEIAPYKLLKLSEEAVYEVASRRLKLFAKL
ncbi:MAG: class II fructose-bisphosphate aldolase [Patescibacteria group bacterium]